MRNPLLEYHQNGRDDVTYNQRIDTLDKVIGTKYEGQNRATRRNNIA